MHPARKCRKHPVQPIQALQNPFAAPPQGKPSLTASGEISWPDSHKNTPRGPQLCGAASARTVISDAMG